MQCCVCFHLNRTGAHFCAQCRTPLILQDRYRITRLLGRGGYGAVYQAEHINLGGKQYAIKELLPEPTFTAEQQQAASEQFRLEANLLAQLDHPALPKVGDFFPEGGRDYLVMDYVEGDPLDELLLARRGKAFPETQALAWARELCDVLTYLHTRKPNPIIHRDIKPANIKIAPDGKLKLIDFGIAKVLTPGTGTVLAARAVSAPYSPMEQYGKGTDTRSDLYACGATLYQLLTNQLPPAAPDRATERLKPPRQINPALSPELEAVIVKAMAEKPSERFQSAAEMKHALPADKKPAAPPPPKRPPLKQSSSKKPPPKKKPRDGCGGLALFALLLGLIGAWLWASYPEIARQQAAQATATRRANIIATATASVRETATAHAGITATAIARATTSMRQTIAARPASKIMSVRADNANWLDTGMFAQKDETINLLQTSGTWSPCAAYNCARVDANGDPSYTLDWGDNVLKGCRHVALLARIGDTGELLCAGSNVTLRANQSGYLQLRINDQRTHDNAGVIEMRIEIK